MRYTRNRQMRKLRSKWPWKVNLHIGTYSNPFIDKSFKWYRDFEGWGENWIEFGGDECTYGELICVKGNNLHLN